MKRAKKIRIEAANRKNDKKQSRLKKVGLAANAIGGAFALAGQPVAGALVYGAMGAAVMKDSAKSENEKNETVKRIKRHAALDRIRALRNAAEKGQQSRAKANPSTAKDLKDAPGLVKAHTRVSVRGRKYVVKEHQRRPRG
jgi:hypothetical protein